MGTKPFAQSIEQRPALSVKEALEYLGVSRAVLYKLLSEDRIAARKLGTRTLIMRDSLDALIASLPRYDRAAASRLGNAGVSRGADVPALNAGRETAQSEYFGAPVVIERASVLGETTK